MRSPGAVCGADRRRRAQQVAAVIEPLECRELLSATAFGQTIHATAGATLSTVLGSVPEASAQGSSFLVNWGNGNASGSAVSKLGGLALIHGSNTYPKAGTYTITIREMSPMADGAAGRTYEAAIFTDTAVVAAPGPFSQKTIRATADAVGIATAGQNISSPLAQLKGVPASAGTITAEIHWGDGSPAQRVTASADAYGKLTPQATHAYARGGVYTATVRFKEGNKVVAAADQTIRVRQNSPGGISLKASTGIQFQQTLGTLTQILPPTEIGIEWGDGTHSPGTVTALGQDRYRITGAHVYATPGNYHVVVTGNADAQPLFPLPGEPVLEVLSRAGGRASFDSTIIVRGQAAQVSAPNVQVSAPAALSAPNATFGGMLAQLTGLEQGSYLPPVYAQIDWGDGIPVLYAPVKYQDGQYELYAAHTYNSVLPGAHTLTNRYGTFTVKVTFLLNDHDYSSLNTVLGTVQTTITSSAI
jgi:hypothetical protein